MSAIRTGRRTARGRTHELPWEQLGVANLANDSASALRASASTTDAPKTRTHEPATFARVHGVPEDFDYGVFLGAALERVCFGACIVQLDFSSSEVPGPLYISVEGKYIHAGPAAEGWSDEVRLPAKSSRLMQLTNHVVAEAARLDSSRMRLAFDHGHSLTLVDDTDEYESFQIAARGRLWII